MFCSIPSSSKVNSYDCNSSDGESTKDIHNINENMNKQWSNKRMDEDLTKVPTSRLSSIGEQYLSSLNFNAPTWPTLPSPAFPARIVIRNDRASSIGSIGSIGDISLPADFLSDFSGDLLNNDDHNQEPTDAAEESLMGPILSFDFPDEVKPVNKDGDERTLLHRACQQYPRNKWVIKAALQKDPSAVLRRALIPGHGSQNKALPSARGCAPEPYQLPINIALSHKASLEVLDLLVKADPAQLSQKDGIHGVNSLCLALEKRPNDVAVLGMFLVSSPNLARLHCDNNENTPLHVACQRGSSHSIIRQLFRLHPASLFQRNENGKTPVDILQQQAMYSQSSNAKASLEYLREKMALGQAHHHES